MKSKKAISLIVLIITIIVMIILASAIILSLDNANIFNKAEEAVYKTNATTNKYLSELKLAERELEKIQGASPVTDTNPGELRQEDDTYYIESIDDLVYFSKLVAGTVEGKEADSFDGKTVKLTRLLDFNSDNSYVDKSLKGPLTGANGSNGFTPIGTDEHPFKGNFDGDGAEIRNIYINNSPLNNVGLFGYVEDANFKNLGITGKIYASESNNVGAIVGNINTINRSSEILNCYSKVQIFEAIVAGGIIGTNLTTADKVLLIQDCYNEGNIISENTIGYAGGIASIVSYANINRCYNLGDINYKQDCCPVAGIVCLSEDSIIMNSYNLGNISNYTTEVAAGIVAYAQPTSIYNSYNIGKIYGLTKYNWNAGIAGVPSYPESNMENCYNIGEVTNGGEIQGNGAANLTNVYYILQKDLTGEEFKGTVINAVEMTLEEMKSQKLVDALNANIGDNIEWARWKLGPKGYPVLDI